jgi:crossover junction endodeoxyribonuclease RuvC
MEFSEQRILGIDPGTLHMGFGLIETTQGNPRLINQGVLQADRKADLQFRLYELFEMLRDWCQKWQPSVIAVEAPFVGVNVQSALAIARAETLVLLIAASRGISVARYAPSQIKQVVTGYGMAAKEQVRFMIAAILDAPETIELDASDALGVAICHAYSSRIDQFIK